MAHLALALKALNAVLAIALDADDSEIVSFQYGSLASDGSTPSSGTIVAEYSDNNGQDWQQALLLLADGTTKASLTAADSGAVVSFDPRGAQAARIRMSVAGDVVVSVSTKRG